MNKRVKGLLAVTCCIVLVVASILGTVAYMTDRSDVTNTFTVGDVDIKLDEADVDVYGKPVPSASRVEDGNEYKLIPNETYVKDPTMTVEANSEESYLRMLVTINYIDVFEDATKVAFLPENYVSGWDRNVWECVEITDVGNNTKTYEFRYHETVDTLDGQPKVLDALFDTFTAPAELTAEHLEKLNNNFKIIVEGHAIQAATFTDADAAWAAFDTQVSG